MPRRVAILITDGAPNQDDTSWDGKITQAANALKRQFNTPGSSSNPNDPNYEPDSVTLFTIGLSMDMVGPENREGLQKIATGGISGGH